MKNKALWALSALVIGAGSLAASAKADELLSSTVSLQLINRQGVSLAQLLPYDLRGSSLRSLMVVASSNDLRNNPSGPNGAALDIFVNGRLLATDPLSKDLGIYQLPLQGIQDAASIELRARSVSGVKLAMVGLTLEGRFPGQDPGNGNPRDPRDPRYSSSMEFRGRLGDVDVFFTGRTAADLNQDCQAYMASSSAGSMNSLQINSVKSTKRYGYWSKAQLCAIATLNASVVSRKGQVAPAVTAGKMGEAPFSIQAETIEEATSRILTFVPLAADSSVNSLELNGVSFTKRYGYWSAAEMANLVNYSFVKSSGSAVAKGTIGDAPYTFAGYTLSEVREQCRTYMTNMPSATSVNRIDIGGTVRAKQYGYWSAEDVCMIVASNVAGGVMRPLPPR
ncbi:MAG: hypothetical protein H7222_13405 [Methylotenera sp.]|nr:hypothetical protein [Oligoflexia bacterium]